jgi:uncharacterized protein YutE (UPF0331/DUF86 family)
MSAEADYIKAESRNILKTVELMEALLAKESLPMYETIALGKLLQDIYTGIERILRSLLQAEGVEIKKTETWHKDLLLAASERGIITEQHFEAFRNLLLFRHLQIHGYGHMLDENRLRDLATPIPALCNDFFDSID